MMQELLRTIYKDMDPQTGMFPADWPCRNCKKTLNADGMRPAELYAGTYTGLCYDCERLPFYVAKTFALDGAMKVSHPPTCPSHSRQRDTFTAYADCSACGGSGVERTEYGRWGTAVRHACQACMDRYDSHPLRQRVDRYSSALYRAAESVWQREAERIARTLLPRKAKKAAVRAKADELKRGTRMDAIKAELLARHDKAMGKRNAIIERYGIYAEVPKQLELISAA